MADSTKDGSIQLPDHTQPSDYSDVQPSNYDPEFISQISSRMQVPDRISVGHGVEKGNNQANYDVMHAAAHFAGMTVPDRIVVAGDNQHIGMRQSPPVDLPVRTPADSNSFAYVGLITPPRTLTLEERFPVVDEEVQNKKLDSDHEEIKPHKNGIIGAPGPYDPGVSLNDSVLLNEEDEATLLRTQVAKLSRRVKVIEEENQKRAGRELVMYPLILGYFLWKILGWFTRDR